MQILTIIGIVLKRRLYPPNLDDIREDVKRSEDVEQTAWNLTQLIEQHGSGGWLNALRQDLGPWLILQMDDLTNVLEIWRKYVLRIPHSTPSSLGQCCAVLTFLNRYLFDLGNGSTASFTLFTASIWR